MSECATAPTRGKRTLRAVILSAGVMLAATASAGAQGFAGTFFDEDILPPRVVAWRLADRGFTSVSRLRFDGRVYIAEAVGPAGVPVRLVVDPATGAILDRQRLPGTELYARLERPPVRTMPGYGWTEDETRPVPAPPPEAGPVARPSRRPMREGVRPLDGNALGLNPDAGPRAEPPRRVARTNPGTAPEKSLSRVSPLAPAPKVSPEAAKPEAAPPAAKANAAPEPAPAKETPAADPKPVAQAAPKAEWKDPPAEGKRPVRVIGGATVVPEPWARTPSRPGPITPRPAPTAGGDSAAGQPLTAGEDGEGIGSGDGA